MNSSIFTSSASWSSRRTGRSPERTQTTLSIRRGAKNSTRSSRKSRQFRSDEFLDIYKLGVMVIPTNRPVARKDANDSVYKTRREKFDAVIKEITTIQIG